MWSSHTQTRADPTERNGEANRAFNKEFSVKAILITVLMIMTPVANACWNDFDCTFGQLCIKSSNPTDEGMCLEQRHPANAMPATSSHQGITCSFDTQCGANGKCITNGNMTGICVKEW